MKRTVPTLVLTSALLTAGCGDDASESTAETDAPSSTTTASNTTASTTEADPASSAEASSSDPDGSGDSGSGGAPDVDMLYACEEPQFMPLSPLVGPGLDPKAGWLEPLQDSYIAHSTQILVRPEQLDAFFEASAAVQTQLEATPGLVAVAFGMDPTCGYIRTLGIWRSEQDMYAFLGSGAHAQAMARTLELSVTGKTVSWSISAADGPPSWESAFAELPAGEPPGAYE